METFEFPLGTCEGQHGHEGRPREMEKKTRIGRTKGKNSGK